MPSTLHGAPVVEPVASGATLQLDGGLVISSESITPVTSGSAFASLTVNGTGTLYRAADEKLVSIDSRPRGDFDAVRGPASAAVGDGSGDGRDDIVGAGGLGHVKVFDGQSGAEIRSFFAFPGFLDSANVGAGDVHNDGFSDLIVTTATGTAHVKVFDGVNGAILDSFFAYGPAFQGGANVAVGDVNGDGFDDVITGAGSGALGHVKVFHAQSGAEIRSFFPFPGFQGTVTVARGDVDGDGIADIITGTAAGTAHVKAFGGNDGALLSFLAFDSSAAQPHVKVFDFRSGAELQSFYAYVDFVGGVFVAGGDVNSDGRADPIIISTITGRITAVASDPSDASGNTIYIGAANGGVWK